MALLFEEHPPQISKISHHKYLVFIYQQQQFPANLSSPSEYLVSHSLALMQLMHLLMIFVYHTKDFHLYVVSPVEAPLYRLCNWIVEYDYLCCIACTLEKLSRDLFWGFVNALVLAVHCWLSYGSLSVNLFSLSTTTIPQLMQECALVSKEYYVGVSLCYLPQIQLTPRFET